MSCTRFYVGNVILCLLFNIKEEEEEKNSCRCYIYSLFKLQYLLICLFIFIGEFYGQNSYNEYLIQNENQMQRLNYPMLDHSMVNTGKNFSFYRAFPDGVK